MRLARRTEIQRIDRLATERYGISSESLMENAGSMMAECLLADPKWNRSAGVSILCGPGKNGGDGQVIARCLREAGVDVRSWVYPEKRMLPTTEEMAESGLIVDALFGVGLNRDVDGEFRLLIERMNKAGRPVVAVDVPSGLDADRGVVLGAAVRATRTLTCGLAKPGFFLQEGPRHVGRVEVLKIGFPPELEREIADSVFLAGAASARRLLPRRSATANKTHFGKVLIIGGSPGMEGAAILSALAAARIGAGYVTMCTPGNLPFDRRPPDFLTLPWARLASEDLSKFSAIVIGPGLGVSEETATVLNHVLSAGVKTVIDADALTLLSRQPEIRPHRNCVLTPHAGELSRLIPRSSAEIEGDRLQAVRSGVEKRDALVLLKGFRTIVDDGERSWIVASGNAALAKAGTGDVLSGFIAGLAAQGLELREAAVLGAYLHGRIADDWVRAGRGRRSLMASDLPELVGGVMESFR